MVMRLGDENEPDTALGRLKDYLSRHPWWAVVAGVASFLVGLGGLWALVDDRPLIPVAVATARSMFPSGAWSMRNVGIVVALTLIAIGLVLPFVVAFAAAHYRREVQRLSRAIAGVTTERDRLRSDTDTLIAERDVAVIALKDAKESYALEKLDRLSRMKVVLNRKESVQREEAVPHATIRYFGYGNDYDIAQKIKGLLSQYAKWDVKLDGSNVPPLPRAEKYKVIFDLGQTMMTYSDLFSAFKEGDLLGVPVARYEFIEREDIDHIIVNVLPSAE